MLPYCGPYDSTEQVLLTERVVRVETDVTVLKAHQFEHECQIDALASAVQSLDTKVDTLSTKFDVLSETVADMQFAIKKQGTEISQIKQLLMQVKDALAI